MARKDNSDPARGFNDVVGATFVAAGLLLGLALFSFDRHDIGANIQPPNETIRNWGGPIGANVGYYLFLWFGAAAYLLPVLLAVFGLAQFFNLLSHLRRRWLWAGVLFVCAAGLFDLFDPELPGLHEHFNAPTAGGMVGLNLNKNVFNYFGRAGAVVVLGALYFVALLYLTNFELGNWIRSLFVREELGLPPDATEEEKALARKQRELEKQARKLTEEVEKSEGGKEKAGKVGLGPDMQPVPAPTVRDLSVPQTKPGARKAKEPKPESEIAGEKPGVEGEIIKAEEISPASTADILGKKAADKIAADKTAVAPATPTTAADEDEDEEKSAKPATAEPSVAAATSVAAAPHAPVRPKSKKPIAVASTPKIGNYQLPSMDLLNLPDLTVRPTETKEELMANARLMQQTLAQFDIEVALGDITKGPTITRYELHPAPGVKLEKITALNNNIAAALKAERIHILAPVPGKSSVGVEVPNLVKTKVIMRDLLEAEEWRNTKARIPLALGKDVYGHPIIADLSDMPHLLIAGSTGSGKSVCINSIVSSLLFKFSPDELRFVMIDPKVVELQQYNSLPHLVVPVVTDPKKVVLALRWVVNEMEKRYQIFAKVGVRNVKSFNERPKHKPLPKAEPELPRLTKKEKIEAGGDGFAVEVDEEIVVPRDEEIVIPDKLSYIIVIIDELADLMLVAPADVEMCIARITQMARAAGIHVIVATQRPSVDVITGVIKANIPARIAFQVASKVDSRTILDAMGADKLLGKGDMLYLPPGSAKLTRAQGALITDEEIHRITEHITKQGKPSYEMDIHQQLSKPASNYDVEEGASGEDEELIQHCIEVIRSEQKASVSLLQRRLRLGYTRAARIMDELEQRGIVGPSKGAEPRDILIDLDGTGADGGQKHAV